MLLVRGDVPISGGKTGHFHLQVIAASNLGSSPDSQVFAQIPDVDLLGDLKTAQSPDTIRMVLRGVGEMGGDRSMTPAAGPRDPSKSFVDLTKDPDNFEFGRRVSGCQKLINPRHGRMFQLSFAALPALENRQRSEDHDGGIANLER